MSLSASKLAGKLEALATPGGFPSSAQEAGQAWADALTGYWADGQAIFGGPSLIPNAALASALAGIFSAQQAGAGAQIDAACTAYWLTPIPWAGIWPGVTTAVVGAGTLGPALDAVMQANISSRASAADACRAIADVFHAWSLTVTVTFTTNTGPFVDTMS